MSVADAENPKSLESSHENSYRSEEPSMRISERDEVAEIKKTSQRDTARVRLWRLVVTLMLVITAFLVTFTTYQSLKKEDHKDFEVDFQQFSASMESAAIQQQADLRDAYEFLSKAISSQAIKMNATWPFFTMPNYELYARDARLRSNTEVVTVFPKVTAENYDRWVQYSNDTYQEWMREGYRIESEIEGKDTSTNAVFAGYHPFITTLTSKGYVEDISRDEYYPMWSFSPPPLSYTAINLNLAYVPYYNGMKNALNILKNQTLFTPVRQYQTAGITFSKEEHEAMHSKLRDSSTEHPHSFVGMAIRKDPNDYDSEIVGTLGGGFPWDASLRNLLPDGVKGIIAVIHNNCNQSFTYDIDGPDAIFVGVGDFHEPTYDHMKVEVSLAPSQHPELETTPGHCVFNMSIYPSRAFEKSYDTGTAAKYTGILVVTFALIVVAFILYDISVQRRNELMIQKAARSNAVVSNIFPSTIRDKLLGLDSTATSLKRAMNNSTEKLLSPKDFASKPLADLFLETTIMYADIVGFTAWSSVREPTQVFVLLENLFGAFDEIAKKRHVFKVETVGDCYVAATGIPTPRKDHSTIMCKFSRDVLAKANQLVRELEVLLGPDTGDLTLRIGIHSGPVTAGVLRGDKARFQLFGDTMNMASIIENTGAPGRIHISKETAENLIAAGRGGWISKRGETIFAKGKGDTQTYWLNTTFAQQECRDTTSDTSTAIDGSTFLQTECQKKTERLIDWVTQILLQSIKQIVMVRSARGKTSFGKPFKRFSQVAESDHIDANESFVDQVKEVIMMPECDTEISMHLKDPENVELPQEVVQQTREYVSWIANTYCDNPFHNFEHAAHVVMSVSKLMSRIVVPSDLLDRLEDKEERINAALLHDHTYGITSDPLTPLACMIAALIHDADHPGVPNDQLIQEGSRLASVYSRSIAEQNSCAVTWDCFADRQFADMRSVIYETPEEMLRFRELLINAVMATDIADKGFKELRNARWERAFNAVDPSEDPVKAKNRKATIVIEHLMQASDVAHTMQHWHVYRKWNERLYFECYRAFKEGRAAADPTTAWHKGEIGFFDFYIIPLAKKLKECGVFGKSSDEYLNYATMNRHEWETRGEKIVAEMAAKAKRLYP